MGKVNKVVASVLLAILVGMTFVPVMAFADTAPPVQAIRLEYLQRIEGTPFAEKKSVIMSIPVYENHTLRLQDVKEQLHCRAFGVMQSYCDTFDYDAVNNKYVAVYYKSVYLNAKTVDGNSRNFYLDCNLSFKDYFYQFVLDEALEADAYTTFLNNMHLEYPQLDGYTADDIYGYWGLIPIPHSHSLNEMWGELFGDATTYSGVLKNFKYTNYLTLDAYNSLLEDYHYGWLEIVWADIIELFTSGSANADFFMIYCDSQGTEAYIAENGADDINDNTGSIINDVEDAVSDVGTWFERNDDAKKVVAIIGAVILVSVAIGIIIRIGTRRKKE